MSQIIGSYGKCVFNFIRNCQTLFQSVLFCIPTSNEKKPPCDLKNTCSHTPPGLAMIHRVLSSSALHAFGNLSGTHLTSSLLYLCANYWARDHLSLGKKHITREMYMALTFCCHLHLFCPLQT